MTNKCKQFFITVQKLQSVDYSIKIGMIYLKSVLLFQSNYIFL